MNGLLVGRVGAGAEGKERAQANILVFGLKPLLPERKPCVCHAIASGWPHRPFSPILYFSCTKPIIKSINNWVFFPPPSLLLNLFLLYISSEMKGKHAGSGTGTRRARERAVIREREKKTAQFAFFFLLGIFKGWVSMLELLFICGNSSSELLRSGSKHFALISGKGQLTLLRTSVFLSAKQIKRSPV